MTINPRVGAEGVVDADSIHKITEQELGFLAEDFPVGTKCLTKGDGVVTVIGAGEFERHGATLTHLTAFVADDRYYVACQKLDGSIEGYERHEIQKLDPA